MKRVLAAALLLLSTPAFAEAVHSNALLTPEERRQRHQEIEAARSPADRDRACVKWWSIIDRRAAERGVQLLPEPRPPGYRPPGRGF